MNKYLRIFGLIFLLCFSFYYTEKLAQFMRSKDPIYESILASMDDYKTLSVNAIIKDNTIIPGLSGEVVNVEKSFENMKNLGYFTEKGFVFDEVLPSVSLKENLDKMVVQGSRYKNGVSFITSDESISSFLEEMAVPYAFLVDKNTVHKILNYATKINNDGKNYKEVDNIMKNKKWNYDFCYVPSLTESVCKEKKKIMIQETIRFRPSNFASNYHSISSGSILYLENLEVPMIKILLNQIYFQGFQVYPLQDLLSESRS